MFSNVLLHNYIHNIAFIYTITVFPSKTSGVFYDVNICTIFNRVFISLRQFLITETHRKLNGYIIPKCLLCSNKSFNTLLSNTRQRDIMYTSHRFPVKNDICKEVGKVKIQF